jgi:hypothetical protein
MMLVIERKVRLNSLHKVFFRLQYAVEDDCKLIQYSLNINEVE